MLWAIERIPCDAYVCFARNLAKAGKPEIQWNPICLSKTRGQLISKLKLYSSFDLIRRRKIKEEKYFQIHVKYSLHLCMSWLRERTTDKLLGVTQFCVVDYRLFNYFILFYFIITIFFIVAETSQRIKPFAGNNLTWLTGFCLFLSLSLFFFHWIMIKESGIQGMYVVSDSNKWKVIPQTLKAISAMITVI